MALALEKLSTHLDSLAGQIFSVEEALGQVLTVDTQTSNSLITKFQSLDFTRQSLEDCALLVHLLSKNDEIATMHLDDTTQACAKLKLDVTRSLIATRSDLAQKSTHGDFDLF